MNRLLKIIIAVAAILLLASFGIRKEKTENNISCCVLCTADLFGEPYTKLEKKVKNALTASGCTITKDSLAADYMIRIEAKAREYGNEKLENEVRNELSVSGTAVTNDSVTSESINIEATAREYSQTKVGGKNVYCAYVDATITIEDNAKGQIIYEDEVSAKGVHTMNYTEAAREGYKSISNIIGEALKDKLGL